MKTAFQKKKKKKKKIRAARNLKYKVLAGPEMESLEVFDCRVMSQTFFIVNSIFSGMSLSHSNLYYLGLFLNNVSFWQVSEFGSRKLRGTRLP